MIHVGWLMLMNGDFLVIHLQKIASSQLHAPTGLGLHLALDADHEELSGGQGGANQRGHEDDGDASRCSVDVDVDVDPLEPMLMPLKNHGFPGGLAWESDGKWN